MSNPLNAVLEISLLFARERNLDKLLQLITEKAIEVTSADRGCIALGQADMIIPKAAVGIRPEEGEQISNTLAREVLDHGEAKMWEDLQDHTIMDRSRSILKQRLRSAMCAPLLVGGKTLGILYVDATTRANYTGADLTVFQALASQAAMAIENAQLFQEMITDALTGLYSAGIFYRRLNEEIARFHRHGRPFSLILADLNGLKAINDNHGHQTGDRALLALAGILRGNIRGGDLPFRYGADDFAVIMPESDREAAVLLLQRLESSCRSITAKELPGWQGASFGKATCPDDGETASELISTADHDVLSQKYGQHR
jgi:diguanylate cyclase (GGDEF)-like protein